MIRSDGSLESLLLKIRPAKAAPEFFNTIDPVTDISPQCEHRGLALPRMTEVDLVATGWVTALDFYEALLAGLGAPEWQGRNVNALIDSMIVGRINKIDPPMVVQISNWTMRAKPRAML